MNKNWLENNLKESKASWNITIGENSNIAANAVAGVPAKQKGVAN